MRAIHTDPVESAHDAGLRYIKEGGAGITRHKRGRGFMYLNAGRIVRDKATLDRIRSLAIPPAWVDVWICPQHNGHLQAVGRDAKGRKQYRYHSGYRRIRDHVKFDRMPFFGAALPRIRRRVRSDLKFKGIPKAKVLAAVVRLLDETCGRVGNDEYARSNGSFGLTTLHNKHARVHGDEVQLRFPGKSGRDQALSLRDDRLARIVRRCQDLPGEDLFQYQTKDGELQGISSGDVNDYLREITDADITAKDFRTWHGTGHMFVALTGLGPAKSEAEAKRNIVSAAKVTASKLGNRPATCRKYYIHPAVIDSYLTKKMFRLRAPQTPVRAGLHSHEAAVLALLQNADSLPARQASGSKARTWPLAS